MDAVFNGTRGRRPVWAGLQPVAGMRGQPGSQLVSAWAPSGPLSVSSSVANCYSLQMGIVVMLGRFPVKVRDCKKVPLVCLAEPN